MQVEEAPQAAFKTRTHVLVVEDERMVMTLIREALADAGIPVHTAGDARSAMRVIHDHGDEIGLILLDWMLPDAPASIVAQYARAEGTRARVVLMSGHTSARDCEARRAYIHGFLPKPFGQRTLLRVARAGLEWAATATAADLAGRRTGPPQRKPLRRPRPSGQLPGASSQAA